MFEDYEQGKLEKLYVAKYLGNRGDEYLAEPTKERLAEVIKECVFGEVPEEECEGLIEIYEISLNENVRKIGEFPDKNLDKLLGGDENGKRRNAYT